MYSTTATAVLLAAVCSEATAQRLIALDSDRSISKVDPATGARTPFATLSVNAGTATGAAYDAATDTVYLAGSAANGLYTLDLATGDATPVGPFGGGVTNLHGLEWDSSTGTLYGVTWEENGLYTIDTTTGAASLVGTSGLTSFTNLGYDSVHDVLYATNNHTDSLYTIDRSTGAATLVGPLSGPPSLQGLAFDCTSRTMFAIDHLADTLCTIDLAAGTATTIGSVGAGNVLALLTLGCTARWHAFGAGCAGGAGIPGLAALGDPTVGATFTTQVTNIPPGSAAFGVIGFSDSHLGAMPILPFDLGLIGMTGCTMLADIAVSVPLVPAGGSAPFDVALPISATGLTFFEQAYVVDAAANPFGLTASNGVRAYAGL